MADIAILTVEGNGIAEECGTLLRKEGHTVTFLVITRPALGAALIARALVSRPHRRALRRVAYDRFFWWAAHRLFDARQPLAAAPAPVHQLDSINADSTAALLRSLAPDLGIVIGTPLVHRSIFSVPRRGMINLHQGHIPSYRGIPPAYWEHRRGEKKMMVTVHRVAETLDLGPVLVEEELDISRDAHFVESKLRANRISGRLLLAGARSALRGDPGVLRQAAGPPRSAPSLLRLALEVLYVMRADRRFRLRTSM